MAVPATGSCWAATVKESPEGLAALISETVWRTELERPRPGLFGSLNPILIYNFLSTKATTTLRFHWKESVSWLGAGNPYFRHWTFCV